eukprot:3775606-Amphidinium_carterae.1
MTAIACDKLAAASSISSSTNVLPSTRSPPTTTKSQFADLLQQHERGVVVTAVLVATFSCPCGLALCHSFAHPGSLTLPQR